MCAKLKQKVEKIGDDVFITFDLHDIRVTLEQVGRVYDNVDQLSRLVPLLVDEVNVVASNGIEKTIDVTLKVPIINLMVKMQANLQIIKLNAQRACIIKVDACGDVKIKGQATFYANNDLTSMFAEFKVIQCPVNITIAQLVYYFIEPLAPTLIETACAYYSDNGS